MSQSIEVHCPACARAHHYTPPSYPCVCGTAVAPALDPRGTVRPVPHRVWDEEWVPARCGDCGRVGIWPRPDVGCPCGTTLRLPVAEEPSAGAGGGGRPAFRPVTIRTAKDAVTTVVRYLNWLGHDGVRRADHSPPAGIGLTAPGVLAQVDPTVRPASLRDVECLWLTALTASASGVYFSLAGYEDRARTRADELGVPLYVLDLTGTPQPVNAVAERWTETGADTP
ncbi:hypothetical protein AB0O01_17570 [Streptomyces sp. NPDC093252]|uniref:hypothetical protein n=1 Tax=Streptomyces sp. NPDC093252 TaxID=3154980 RepID=UPI0034195C55